MNTTQLTATKEQPQTTKVYQELTDFECEVINGGAVVMEDDIFMVDPKRNLVGIEPR